MKTYRTQGGDEYEISGNKAAPLIRKLRDSMMADPGSNRAYMRRLGNLVADMYNTVIDIENEEQFIKGLVALGILERVKK